ncbi:MAG: hypothetical protein ACLP3R_11140 [Candidatus Korobacteraceae bacterium]
MTTKLGEILREKFKDPREVLRALGLDEDILDKGTSMTAKPTKFANLALQLTAAYVKPLLAKDAKIDLMPVFAGVTRKNFKTAEVKIALDAALKGKLAKDAEPGMGHVAQILDHIESMAGPQADESVSKEQHNAMEAAAHGHSNLGIPKSVGEEFEHADKGKTFDNIENLKGFLKEKGMGEDDIMKACDMAMPKNALDDSEGLEAEKAMRKEEKIGEKLEGKDAELETEEEKKKAEDKKAEDKKAHDAEMVTKPAMDAAIDAAVKATEKRVMATQRAISKAKEDVYPYVGQLAGSMAFDSSDDVYKAALEIKGVDVKGIHPSAYPKILSYQPKAGAKEPERDAVKLGMDSDAVKKINEKFPGIAAIGTA